MNFCHNDVKWSDRKIDIAKLDFFRDFFRGTATSAYQVEGGCDHNDWSVWERSFAENANPRIKGGQKPGLAVNHWNRYRDDIDLLKQTGGNAYRFSVEWSKVCPKLGVWDRRVIDHYIGKCAYLNENGIKPFVTLHHFTIPGWLYEPAVYAMMGWVRGIFPPGKRDPCLAARVLNNLLKAHFQAYHAIHETDQSDADGDGVPCKVGIIKNITIFDPARKWWLPDWIGAKILHRLFNQAVLEAFLTDRFAFNLKNIVNFSQEVPGLSDTLDWISVNYYTQYFCKPDRKSDFKIKMYPNQKTAQTDMGWAVYPAGLHRVLQMIRLPGVPIYITENGIATEDETLRQDFILKHVEATREVMLDGCDIRGYFYRSLLDNFEWAEGFDKRFGLYHVDFDPQKRPLKEGVQIYKEIIHVPGHKK
ncbi:MAG: family 1 glycosylhydrolase [Candidatus Marinimicrobia bacterium]|nr:family 1 glycosylhydrolase [Candidatus Neomarinimicrobiota bacterium]